MAGVVVEFYGVLQEAVGASQVEWPVRDDRATVGQIVLELCREYPVLEQYVSRVACVLGDEIVPRSTAVRPGSRMALLPPVSGG